MDDFSGTESIFRFLGEAAAFFAYFFWLKKKSKSPGVYPDPSGALGHKNKVVFQTRKKLCIKISPKKRLNINTKDIKLSFFLPLFWRAMSLS